jgi:hypothetical protein
MRGARKGRHVPTAAFSLGRKTPKEGVSDKLPPNETSRCDDDHEPRVMTMRRHGEAYSDVILKAREIGGPLRTPGEALQD